MEKVLSKYNENNFVEEIEDLYRFNYISKAHDHTFVYFIDILGFKDLVENNKPN